MKVSTGGIFGMQWIILKNIFKIEINYVNILPGWSDDEDCRGTRDAFKIIINYVNILPGRSDDEDCRGTRDAFKIIINYVNILPGRSDDEDCRGARNAFNATPRQSTKMSKVFWQNAWRILCAKEVAGRQEGNNVSWRLPGSGWWFCFVWICKFV